MYVSTIKHYGKKNVDAYAFSFILLTLIHKHVTEHISLPFHWLKKVWPDIMEAR